MNVLVERYQRRKYVNQPDSQMLYYVRQKSGTVRVMDINKLADAIEANSSLTAGDVKHSIEAFVEQLRLSLTQGDKVKIDALGNVICRKKGSGKRIMVAAHMDVIGFMVNRFEKDGFLQVTNIGGHRASRLSGKKVRFLSGVQGVLFERSDAELKTKTGDKAAMTDLFLDIGAASEEEARKMVRVGDVAVFDYEAKEIGDGLLMSPYCDNLASCAAMLCAMSQVKKTENDLYFVFTVQEEQGLKGSKTSAHAIEPDLGIAIDLTHAGDCPGAAERPRHQGQGRFLDLHPGSGGASAEIRRGKRHFLSGRSAAARRHRHRLHSGKPGWRALGLREHPRPVYPFRCRNHFY